MFELRIITGAAAVPIFDLPAVMGRSGARRELGDQIEAMIAFMDDLDGDADFEDATDAEDDFNLTAEAKADSILFHGEIGCPVSDPGGCQHDGREPEGDEADSSWPESSSVSGRLWTSPSEDDEDNGDREGVDDDTEPNGDERDGNGAEDDFMAHGWNGPGCPISDPGGGTEGEC